MTQPLAATEPALHRFDWLLCNHAAEIAAGALAANESFDRLLGAGVPGSVRRGEPYDTLPSTFDLRRIEFYAGFAMAVGCWTPDSVIYEGWVDCVGEIRGQIGQRYCDSWHRYSTAAVEELHEPHLAFSDGLQIVREWIGEARRLLRACGRMDLVPPVDRPGGVRAEARRDARMRAMGFAVEPPRAAAARPTGQGGRRPARRRQVGLSDISDIVGEQVTPSPDDFLTPPEVAKRLGKSVDAVLTWIRSGELRAADLARRGSSRPRYQIRQGDLDDLLRRRSTRPAPSAPPRARRREEGVTQFV